MFDYLKRLAAVTVAGVLFSGLIAGAYAVAIYFPASYFGLWVPPIGSVFTCVAVILFLCLALEGSLSP